MLDDAWLNRQGALAVRGGVTETDGELDLGLVLLEAATIRTEPMLSNWS